MLTSGNAGMAQWLSSGLPNRRCGFDSHYLLMGLAKVARPPMVRTAMRLFALSARTVKRERGFPPGSETATGIRQSGKTGTWARFAPYRRYPLR